ncbi:hypothetical protein HCK00_26585, partial [Streptomyces sp. PLAI1-29]
METDRGVPGGRYEAALRGIAALETLRANDPAVSRHTPFRLELWTFLARRTGDGTLDEAAYLRALEASRTLLDGQPDARLGDQLPDSELAYAAGEFGKPGRNDLVRDILRKPTGSLSSADIARAFWATTAAARVLDTMEPAEREHLGRGVLHVPATVPWSDERSLELGALVARAHARGLDSTDRHVLAALHLVELGAFRPASHVTDGTSVHGYNWSGVPTPDGVDLDRTRAVRKTATGKAFDSPAPPWASSPTKPWMILTGMRQGIVELHLPGAPGPVRVPDAELWALLDLDPVLSQIGLGRPVAFLTSEFKVGTTGTRSRAQAFTDRTGRSAWAYTGPLEFDPAGPGAPSVVTARRDKKLGMWRKTTWQARPVTASAGPLVTTGSPDVPDVGSLTLGESGSGGLLAAGTLLTSASGGSRGRNWTGEKVRQVRLGRVRVFEERPGVALREVSEGAAPWGDAAWVVWAGGDASGVRGPDGRVLSAEQVAAELAADPELAKLPKDVPVVLVVPEAANSLHLGLLRAVANRLGRTVWAPSGEGRLVRRAKQRDHVLALVDTDPERPVGAWVPFQPTSSAGPVVSVVDRSWTGLDGTVFRDSGVGSRPLVSDRGERFGRMSHADDARVREELLRSYHHASVLTHMMPTGGKPVVISEEARADSGPDGPAVYTFVAHGVPGAVEIGLGVGRSVWLSSAAGGLLIGGS